MSGIAPLATVVRSDSKLRTVSELVEASKSTNINYASGGNGIVNHLAMKLRKKTTGARMTHIPYKGSAPAMTDLLGGGVDVMFETLPPTLPHIKSGRLRALAVSSASRVSLLPEIPTVAETYPGFEAVPWNLFCVPRGTPHHIIDRLAQKLVDLDTTPAKTRAWVLSEYAKFGKVIQDTGVRIE